MRERRSLGRSVLFWIDFSPLSQPLGLVPSRVGHRCAEGVRVTARHLKFMEPLRRHRLKPETHRRNAALAILLTAASSDVALSRKAMSPRTKWIALIVLGLVAVIAVGLNDGGGNVYLALLGLLFALVGAAGLIRTTRSNL